MNIDRIDCPNFEQFMQRYLQPSVPVIIRGGLAGAPAMQWTPEHLVARVGHKDVDVRMSASDGLFGYDNTPGRPVYTRMSFAAAVAKLGTAGDAKYYISQRPIREDFPELLDDVRYPSLLEHIFASIPLNIVNIWVSGAGCISRLHYDDLNNFLVQIHGRKRIVLFAPSDFRYLYPFADSARNLNDSRVDVDRASLEDFPLFQHATPIELTLVGGEMLFIPTGWYHYVRSLDTCISVNAWWRSLPHQFFELNMLRALRINYSRNRLHGFDAVAHLGETGLIGWAEHALHEKRAFWVAVVLAAAALHQSFLCFLRMHGVDDTQLPMRFEAYRECLAQLKRDALLPSAAVTIWNEHVAYALDPQRYESVGAAAAATMLAQAHHYASLLSTR